MTQLSDPNNQKPVTKNSNQGNWWLVISFVVLATFPLIFVKGEYNGADGQAHDAIGEVQPEYKPWIEPFTEPASGEVEGFFFAAQAGLGAGTIGYIIGLYKGRHSQKNQTKKNNSLDND